VEGPIAPRAKSLHLMCGTPFWGVASAVACAYFGYLAYSRLRDGDFAWQHEWWTVLTWAVWIVLLAGLLSETRCWRERAFFGLLFLNFLLGLVLAAWRTAPASTIREAREVSLGLWIFSVVASLTTVSRPTEGTSHADG
jgi:hypothetical protein